MRAHQRDRGQIIPVAAFALVVLLGIAAFAIDVGYAYYAKRQLQGAADAAALAGAQDLPSVATAMATAASYAAANTPANVSFDFSYEADCTHTAVAATGCNPAVNPNKLVVSATARTHTWFAGIFGIDQFEVAARASACSPCSSTPVDIVVAIDRTGSMCDRTSHGDCIDLDNAKDGVRTMLGMLNPPAAQIGMVAFPPVRTTGSDPCSAPYNSLGNQGYDGYDAPGRGYVADIINGDYKRGSVLNPLSGLYRHTEDGGDSSCIQAGGNTSYSEALRQAKAELDADGRPGVPDYIIFLTDGEANIGSVYGVGDATYPPGNADDQQPCHTAINLADAYKQAGVTIYSVGYDLGANVRCTAGDWPTVAAVPARYNKKGKLTKPGVPAHPCNPATESGCYHTANGHPESPAITSTSTLSQIASPGNFYNQPSPGQLNTIFAAIATDIGSGSSRLVNDGF